MYHTPRHGQVAAQHTTSNSTMRERSGCRSDSDSLLPATAAVAPAARCRCGTAMLHSLCCYCSSTSWTHRKVVPLKSYCYMDRPLLRRAHRPPPLDTCAVRRSASRLSLRCWYRAVRVCPLVQSPWLRVSSHTRSSSPGCSLPACCAPPRRTVSGSRGGLSLRPLFAATTTAAVSSSAAPPLARLRLRWC